MSALQTSCSKEKGWWWGWWCWGYEVNENAPPLSNMGPEPLLPAIKSLDGPASKRTMCFSWMNIVKILSVLFTKFCLSLCVSFFLWFIYKTFSFCLICFLCVCVTDKTSLVCLYLQPSSSFYVTRLFYFLSLLLTCSIYLSFYLKVEIL